MRAELTVGGIEKNLEKERTGRITVFDTIDSTNDYLKKLCAEGKAEPGDIVTANRQTAGRGRRGKSFESAAGVGIYLSALLKTNGADPGETAELTAWGAVAVCRAIERVCGEACCIKWVNDLVCGSRKVCGILTEMTPAGPVMGIGVNVNQRAGEFPAELRDIATSLREACGRETDREKLIAAMIEELDRLSADFPHARQPYLDEYRSRCAVLGKEITLMFGETQRRGRAVGIDEHFGLVVQYDDGDFGTVTGGEVSVRGFYGV